MKNSLPILNISAYLFTEIADPAALQGPLRERAVALGLKGTVLIATEGINIFLAGSAESVRSWVQALQADARFATLNPKESWSATVPFKKLLVKVKAEIIRMNMPAIRPMEGRAPAVAPATLARWLETGRDDAGRELVLLDTRNAFEVDHGAFDQCIDWRINKFTEFPAALEANRESLKDKTVVSYCTGGIRCEKAAIVMQNLGLDHVYQLEGGILKYFEETASPGWHGSCFVFDERVALDPGLNAAE